MSFQGFAPLRSDVLDALPQLDDDLVADEGAVPFAGGIVVLGGRGPGGKLASVTLLRPG